MSDWKSTAKAHVRTHTARVEIMHTLEEHAETREEALAILRDVVEALVPPAEPVSAPSPSPEETRQRGTRKSRILFAIRTLGPEATRSAVFASIDCGDMHERSMLSAELSRLKADGIVSEERLGAVLSVARGS